MRSVKALATVARVTYFYGRVLYFQTMSASAVSPRTAAALQATLDRVKALQTLDPSLSVADAA